MATGAKTKPRKRASTASKSPRSRSQASTRSKAASRRKPASSSRGSNGRRTTSAKRRSTSSANGSGRIEEARKAVTSAAQDAGHSVGDAASKAKVPLIAGSAALAGIAGGVAIGAKGLRRRKVLGVPMPRRSVLKKSTKNLADAAREAGNFGRQMGELTSEVHKTREAMDDKHRSPIEVVLQGLTRRAGV
jgi:hypothetical protein